MTYMNSITNLHHQNKVIVPTPNVDSVANDVIELWSKTVMSHSLLTQITSPGQMLEVNCDVKVVTVSNAGRNKQVDNIRRY